MEVRRTDVVLKANPSRVLLRAFTLVNSEERNRKIISRVLSLSEAEVEAELERVLEKFSHRHRDARRFFAERFQQNHFHLPEGGASLSEARQLLIGAYFTMEYSPEAAALFNPSLVWHPDQSGLPPGARRFILSLRATGEGHISSLVFRTGVITADNRITVDDPGRLYTQPHHELHKEGYEATFDEDVPLPERILFPFLPAEKKGIEDARFTMFRDEDGGLRYYATYTGYDGTHLTSMLLETTDFRKFRITPLTGAAVQNKGKALFPRKIEGRYAMLARQDNENNYLMFSDDLYRWENKVLIQEPRFPWEFVQLGNCGAPIETEAGWLVLSHAVGPVRQYVLSAFLLDREDPTRVIGHLKEPLLAPDETEREGYVPNVVYSCGAQVHGDTLVIPYAMSDTASRFALVNLPELLEALRE